jgi:hypothetical protein
MEPTETTPEGTESVPEPMISVPEPSPYLFSVDTILSEYEILSQKEAADRTTLDTIEFPNTEDLRGKLLDWARRGFPDIFPIFSIVINPPTTCIDGVSRSLFGYIDYLMGITIAEKMNRLASKLGGMTVTCSYTGNRITFHVTKQN